MTDSKIIIEVKADGSTTITINSAAVTVVTNEEPVQQEMDIIEEKPPTEGQRYYLMSRGKWDGNLTKEQAHVLIGRMKEEEAANDPRGATDAVVRTIIDNGIERPIARGMRGNTGATPLGLTPRLFEDTPVKKKRGRPRKEH